MSLMNPDPDETGDFGEQDPEPRHASPGDDPEETQAPARRGGPASEHEPKEIATLPPVPVLEEHHRTSPRTGEPVRPAAVLVAMLAFLTSAAGMALAYGMHWWQAVHPSTYLSSANLIRWVDPDPGKWLSLTLEGVLAIAIAIVAGVTGAVGFNAWNGWGWTRLAGVGAVLLNVVAVVLFGWWAIAGTAAAVVGCGLLFLPRVREFFDEFDAHRGARPAAYRRPQAIFYGRLPRFR